MLQLTEAQKVALDHARHLAENEVPIFVAKAEPGSPLGFRLPVGWQRSTADPASVDAWRPGDALCAVMGHLVDAVDVDPRHGGSDASLGARVPHAYGRQATPSGGFHLLVASLGLRSRDGVLPGVDVKAGDPEGGGRGFIFLAPTERRSKVSGETIAYRWVEPPELTALALLGPDATGAALAELVRSCASPTAPGVAAYDGPSYADLTASQRADVEKSTAALLEDWKGRLRAARDWPEGETDAAGNGWEALSYKFAWALAKVAVAPWSGLDGESAQQLYDDVLPPEIAVDDKCKGKWSPALLAKAAAEPVEPPNFSWTVFGPVTDRQPVDVTNESSALTWLEEEVGRGRSSSVFRRGRELVHTPRIGEAGYVEPRDDADSSGPAQVRRIDALELARRIDHGYAVTRRRSGETAACLFPQTVASRAASAPDLLLGARDLLGVTHTPVVRADGTILDDPGYDPASRMLYLPDPALRVPQVPECPSPGDVQRAGGLLLDMVADFPFVTPHDRANYLGALLTPLLRPLVPPPYKLVAVGAPQRGSGKSLLAWIVRELHGGVFKSEFPTTDNELRKFITSTLDATTSPVVQFDNVTGVLRSSVFDGLLTSRDWSDRLLGQSTMLALQNDRLWMVTGNNVHIGGDLERRTLWITIDANMERPEERRAFTIPALETWVTERRGELLWALLTLVRSWVVAGRQTDEAPTSDGFGQWVAVVRGILGTAHLGDVVGVFGHAESVRGAADPEHEEWATFLAAAHRVFGSEPWTAKDLLRRTATAAFDSDDLRAECVLAEELPGNLGERLDEFQPSRAQLAATKSLGKWLSYRDGRWAGGLQVRRCGDRRDSTLWQVVDKTVLG